MADADGIAEKYDGKGSQTLKTYTGAKIVLLSSVVSFDGVQ